MIKYLCNQGKVAIKLKEYKMKRTLKNKLLTTLAILALLYQVSVVRGSELDARVAQASANLRIAAETHNFDCGEGDVRVNPKGVVELGKAQVGYDALFRQALDEDGKVGDLQTIIHKLSLRGENMNLEAGRTSLRQFGNVGTVDSFDNYMAGKGMTRNFTGVFAEHKPSHLTLGVCSSDTTMSPTHWDMLAASWSPYICENLGIQVHGAATKDHLEKAGVAVSLKPTEKLALLADAVYSRDGTSAMLLGNYQANDKLKVFGGAEVTAPSDSTATGKAIAGVEGKLRRGFHAIGAVQQDFSFGKGGEETTAILGVRFSAEKAL